MNIQEFFLKQKEAMRVRTRQVTSLLREDEMSWRPVPGALSVGEMVRHMWVSEEGVRRVALAGDFTYYEKRIPHGLNAVVGKPRMLAEELDSLEKVHAETLVEVAKLPLERWDDERVNEQFGIRRKIAVILFGIIEHEVHHRAQLMTYLRMLGTPAPEPFVRK
ncbi:MAG TPA: DinB family protein [Candidatus Acidoferrum sp.]|nr:DinB family protein [Candidatus Acidoferrum sp.]